MIKLVVFDVDGVLTDGSMIVDCNGVEQKKINLKDIDAVFELKRRGFLLAAITGEDTGIVNYFEKRFPWDYFYRGVKEKEEILEKMCEQAKIYPEEICYIGDGKYDVSALSYVGLGICPADAIDKAKTTADIILQREGGKGCVWEILSILENYNNTDCAANYFYQRLQEHTAIFKKLASDVEITDSVMSLAKEIYHAFKNGNALYLCGNGGSAADAQHIATEFVSRFYRERKAMNAEALTVNTSTLTAVGNDYSFERIFVRQLEAKAKRGDILIGISTSGSSRNVLNALQYAREHEIKTALLMGGFCKEELRNIADYIIKVPSLITPRIQEAHIFIGHLLAEYVEYTISTGK